MRGLATLRRVAAAVLATVPMARGQLACHDGFEEYGSGAQLEDGANGVAGTAVNGGFGWGGAYDVNNAIKSLVRAENRAASPVVYSNGGVTIHGGERALRFYDIANGSYAVRRPLGQAWEAAAGQELWCSFLFRCNNASPLANQDFLAVGFDDNPAALSGNPRVSVGVNTVATVFPPSQPFRFFARSTTVVANSAFSEQPDVATGTTYLVVCRVAASGAGNYDTVDLWVNPADPTEPGPPAARMVVDSGLARLTHWFVRTANLDAGDAYVLDELRIGRRYASVVLPAPPPFALEIRPVTGAAGELRWSRELDAELEASTTLAPDSWSVVPGPFEAEAGWWQWRAPAGPARGFYRLRRRGL